MSPKIITPLNRSFAKEMKLENLLVCIILNAQIELHIGQLRKESNDTVSIINTI